MIKRIFSSELARGSFILFIMINIFNALNWFFHFAMIRLMTKAEYGILAVLMSIAYIFAVPSESIHTVISRYTSKFNIKKEFGKIKFLLFLTLKKCWFIATILFIIFLFISIFLSRFLQISFPLLVLTGLVLFMAFLMPVNRGILQGRKKFIMLGTNMIVESVSKLVLAIIFVAIGWYVAGAMAGVVIGIFISFLLAFLFMKEVINSNKEEADIKGIYSYSFPVLIAILAIVLMYSLDIILARRFFSPIIAGEYAAISMLGKIIFFGTLPISKAMFPITSENFENGKKTTSLLYKSFLIVLVLCLIALLFFALVPRFIIKIWTGSAIGIPLITLLYVGIALSFLSFTNIVVLYGLSINKFKNSYLLLIFVVLEIVLLSIFNRSPLQFSLAFLVSNLLMFITSLLIIKK